jgi:biotin transport system substrate-specific component
LSKEISVHVLTGAATRLVSTRQLNWIRNLAIVLSGSLFLAVCSHIALPLFFTPVPLTLQPFAVLLLGLLLSPQLAFGVCVAYLAEGAMGLPVFAPAPALAGIAHLLGPTGGYLLSYPAAAALVAVLRRRIAPGPVGMAFSATMGSLTILASGALWLAVITHTGINAVLVAAVVPFIPGDLLKIAAAVAIAGGVQRFRRANT